MSHDADGQGNRHEDCRDDREGDFWITPVKSTSSDTAEAIIQKLVGERNAYALGWRAHGRKSLKAGDWICFYIAKKGVVGHARVKSPPQERIHNWITHPERYPWVFDLECVQLYLDRPTRFDHTTRKKLEAFEGRENEDNVGWFVQSTRRISRNDYYVLTGIK